MKYSVGQKVKIRSLEWYRDNVNRYGIIECGKYEFFEPMDEYCGKVVTIKRIDDDNYRIDTDKGTFCWTDEMIECKVEEETYDFLKTDKPYPTKPKVEDFLDMFNDTITLPEGFIFRDQNGNIIDATKIVLEKKKKEYPKTYEECCKVLRYDPHRINDMGETVLGYKRELIRAFQMLVICRDAYWKIAGEEMGLDGPWEPDWNTSEPKYVIACTSNGIEKQWETTYCKVFAFPTEEMRDAFYENFKELIEKCKELL